jgi:hypothetical protein
MPLEHNVMVRTGSGMKPLGIGGEGGDPPVVVHEAALPFVTATRHKAPTRMAEGNGTSGSHASGSYPHKLRRAVEITPAMG